MFYDFVSVINGVLWGQVLVYLLIAVGVWFSARLGLIQLRSFKHMFSLLRNSRRADNQGISSFQALCTSLSARIGTGNLAGVAIAITVGGPGAVFWMWVIALLGMATGFAESLLAQVYKVRDSSGEFRGGPAYYIRQGLKRPYLGMLFSISLLFGYGFVFSATQTNTIVDALNHSYQFPVIGSAAVITLFAGVIVMGGLRSIARFCELVVPIMGVGFVLVAVSISIINIAQLPELLLTIVKSAFGWQEAGAGTFAAALKNGIQRGLYSNEAGAGSVPQAAASASPHPNHPASQGYIQMLGVFLDTIIVCSCTAFVIMLAGGASSPEMEGIRLTQRAMTEHLGAYGGDFVAVTIALFGFTSVVANYAYAESNLHFFKLDNKTGRGLFTIIFLTMMFSGSLLELKVIWALADMAFGLMAVINVIALICLSKTVIAVTRDYQAKQITGKVMAFKRVDCDIQGDFEDDIWK